MHSSPKDTSKKMRIKGWEGLIWGSVKSMRGIASVQSPVGSAYNLLQLTAWSVHKRKFVFKVATSYLQSMIVQKLCEL